jgi:broad specificity phosphatase PhoE
MVRHGETVWHAENRYTGASDIPLTDRGREQAQRLAAWAATAGLAACWSSGLARAVETLSPAAAAAGLLPRQDDRLREIEFGEGEGLTGAEMRERFPDQYAAFDRDPVGNHLPGGEDPVEAVRRATACLDEIAAEFDGGRVLVVWHSTLMRVVLCDWLGIPLSEYRRRFPLVRNVGLTEVRVAGSRRSLLQYNTPIDMAVPEEDRR